MNRSLRCSQPLLPRFPARKWKAHWKRCEPTTRHPRRLHRRLHHGHRGRQPSKCRRPYREHRLVRPAESAPSVGRNARGWLCPSAGSSGAPHPGSPYKPALRRFLRPLGGQGRPTVGASTKAPPQPQRPGRAGGTSPSAAGEAVLQDGQGPRLVAMGAWEQVRDSFAAASEFRTPEGRPADSELRAFRPDIFNEKTPFARSRLCRGAKFVTQAAKGSVRSGLRRSWQPETRRYYASC